MATSFLFCQQTFEFLSTAVDEIHYLFQVNISSQVNCCVVWYTYHYNQIRTFDWKNNDRSLPRDSGQLRCCGRLMVSTSNTLHTAKLGTY